MEKIKKQVSFAWLVSLLEEKAFCDSGLFLCASFPYFPSTHGKSVLIRHLRKKRDLDFLLGKKIQKTSFGTTKDKLNQIKQRIRMTVL